MTNRSQLVAEWQSRLAECRQELLDSQQTGRASLLDWGRRAYVRLLTFLLSQYGGPTADEQPRPAAQSDDEAAATVQPTSSSVLDPPIASWTQTPPKSADRIRASITRIQSQAPPMGAGPLAAGLTDSDPVVAGRVRREWPDVLIQERLSIHGIRGRIYADGAWWIVQVPYRDGEAARQVLEHFHAKPTDGIYKVTLSDKIATALAPLAVLLLIILWIALIGAFIFHT
ncbi:MAG: hypothetical protein AB7O62_03415 [Pirellulales bacterium]